MSTCCYIRVGGISAPSTSLADEAIPCYDSTWQEMAQLCTDLLLNGCRTSFRQTESKMDTTCNPAEVPGSLVLFKVVGWEVNGTIFTRIMQKSFIGMSLEHHQFAALAQATKQLICHHWEQSRRGRHCKGFVCLDLCVASSSAQ